MQKRLLAEPKLKFAKDIEIAQGLVTDMTELSSSGINEGTPVPVHHVAQGNKKFNCYRYGLSGHNTSKCRMKDVVCHHCGKR